MASSLAFIDLEISKDGRIADIGCIRTDGLQYHGKSVRELYSFLEGVNYLCGHNIIQHDLKYLDLDKTIGIIDTLYLSPLFFPAKPYHRLVKDYKLDPENRNNPLSDAIKARELLEDEISAFLKLDTDLQSIYYQLLHKSPEFGAFFKYCEYKVTPGPLKETILKVFKDGICSNTILDDLIRDKAVELAYTLSLTNVNDLVSVFPPWLIKAFSGVQYCFRVLRSNVCFEGCTWCNSKLDPKQALRRWFGYSAFRSFDGEPLQENAIKAAIRNKSLLSIFPTGGGKSITFQLPALIAGETERGLTVIISPLQSLMKDQVDNLEKKSITAAVTINGLLDPIERAASIERVQNGGANLLYISPESLRSNTIERLLEGRHIARFVIDEAHCFSAWGQDFRVDYLYIGDFIKKLQQAKNLDYNIPVSCFTATAKQKVIEDISLYFKEKLNLSLELYTTTTSRPNLQYKVVATEQKDKYLQLRALLEADDCPAIIYVSRTKKAEELAKMLNRDGFNVSYYHGKLDSHQRISHQDAFMTGDAKIMVATSAFGMGVDKSNVGMVIHYEISDSLENYIQEAGRAGRDENVNASCYVLYDEDDLNKHFVLLNQTKLTVKEIRQVWKAIKELTRTRPKFSNSALEIARKAGWDDEVNNMETRIITAVAALEDSGYLIRRNNSPRVFATGILAKNADEAINTISGSQNFSADEKVVAIRIIKRLFSAKKSTDRGEEGESRVDYLADHLGLQRELVIRIITLLRQENLLADSKDLTAFVKKNARAENSIINLSAHYIQLEEFLLKQLRKEPVLIHLKELIEKASTEITGNVNPAQIKTILNIWAIQGWIKKDRDIKDNNYYRVQPKVDIEKLLENLDLRRAYVGVLVRFLFEKTQQSAEDKSDEVLIEFSVLEAKDYLTKANQLFQKAISISDVEDTLFYLSRIEAIKLEGGFMVIYNRLTIERKEMNFAIQYKNDDYKKLSEHYVNKVQQIHIVGEYAQRMIENYRDALQFIEDYFQINYNSFLAKYFPGKRKEEINRKITKRKYDELFGDLSPEQRSIVADNDNQYIVVAAGPGSGKTRVLVHKLASLLQLEDVKHEQLLMLTFSRAAASEFKERLHKLVGNAAYFVEIKTFHSYCFDLLGRIGNLEKADGIIKLATEKIRSGEIVMNRITKSVLVLDEAQDINTAASELIKLLVEKNEEMRVILVGDDDQNIFEWDEASPECLEWFLHEKHAKYYTLLDNYRSCEEIVAFANQFVNGIRYRLKGEPILSKKGNGGKIDIYQYSSRHLVSPLVNNISKIALSGSMAVLTTTNEEAAMIAGLLTGNGFAVKLIQSNDGFRLNNLLELRFFSKLILTAEQDIHTIDMSNFDESTSVLKNQFAYSPNIDLVLRIISRFRNEYALRMYKSDWQTFLAESKMEDFYSEEAGTIQVATIHKAKGKEFDNVILLLDSYFLGGDEKRRVVYVAITRARVNLHIHYNQTYFQGYKTAGVTHFFNDSLYAAPDSLSFVLSMTQVWLSYFDSEYRQRIIGQIKPGDLLEVNADDTGCSLNGHVILKFSKDFKVFLNKFLSEGYILIYSAARHIVYWQTESGREIPIVLPGLRLKRQ